MFGYVRPYRASLTMREYEFYRGIYCGVCRSLKKETGLLSTFSLNYDLVFLALCRMTTGENHVKLCPKRCMAHPTCKRAMVVENDAVDYAARVLSLLTYHKLRDDVQDNRGIRKFFSWCLLGCFRRAHRLAGLAPLDVRIAHHLDTLSRLETQNEASVDLPARVFGELLGEIFSYECDPAHEEALYALGEMLGKFIYCADAAEDYQKDKKKKNYNPYVLTYPVWDAKAKSAVRDSLLVLLQEGEAQWHKLPFQNTVMVRHLIQNILYEGLVRRLDFLLPDWKKPKKKEVRPYDGVLP